MTSNRIRYRILTDESANVKLSKSLKTEWLSVGLSLAPHSLSGINVCQHSTAACRAFCVAHAGNGSIPNVGSGRIKKTQRLFSDQPAFLDDLRHDLRKAELIAAERGKRVACRLNVFSDLPWERIAPQLFTRFPHVQFYDYTKSATRAASFADGLMPVNYHLTFSRSEQNEVKAVELLMRGVSVAVVFPQFRGFAMPETWHDFPVVDGDNVDLRFLDPRGVVIGLRAKGRMRGDNSGMVDRSPADASILDVLS